MISSHLTGLSYRVRFAPINQTTFYIFSDMALITNLVHLNIWLVFHLKGYADFHTIKAYKVPQYQVVLVIRLW